MPGGASLGSRAIIGEFYATLGSAAVPAWVPRLAYRVESNQETEELKWLGMSPAMREWVNGRRVAGLRADGLRVTNKPFEATLEVSTDDLRRDKTGQILTRVRELATRARQHDTKLLSSIITSNPLCYDGQNFFDTDHVTADSGTQSNVVTFDLSDKGGANAGTPAAPSSTAMARAMADGVARIMGFKDDVGEPLNEGASAFVAMVPTSLMAPALAASNLAMLALGEANVIPNNSLFSIVPVVNPRLDAWTDSFALFRADGEVKPLILQVEVDLEVQAVAEGSEEEFLNRRHLYGVSRSVAAAPGYWQHAAKVTFQA